jgi:hypothetical protein
MKSYGVMALGLLASWSSWGHEGHGLGAGSHWHASDALGFVAALVIALVLWAWGRGK